MKDNKKTLIITTVAVIFLIIIVIGATYAYFKAQTGDAGNVPTQVTTNTTDSLVLETGADISITADTTTFAEGMDNRTGESFARATLKANNKTNSASGNYYVYFDVTKNELQYTTEAKNPELLLKITNPNNEEITSGIKGLEYKTVIDGQGNEVSGFDITEYTGLLTIVNNKEILSTSETTEKYDTEVILVNLDDDQTSNGGKSFVGKLIIQKEKLPTTIAEACQDKELGSCIAENNRLDKNIYYHKNLENSAEDGSYRYAGSYESVKNYVCFGSDENTCDNDHLYRIIGIFNNQAKIIKADYATESQLGKASYNLSNIKSSFPNYKGILELIPIYYWSGSNTSTDSNWVNSTLNTNSLNKIFLETFNATWQNKIAVTSWQVGGNLHTKITHGKDAISYKVYESELINPVENIIENKKIGLMYVSDYMYAAIPTYWTYPGHTNKNYLDKNGKYGAEYDYRAAINDNWLYLGIDDWTITRFENNQSAFTIGHPGYTYYSNVSLETPVRPVFYLNSDVKLIDGTGTQSNPYRIS